MDFDRIIRRKQNGILTEYGIVNGNDAVFLVKTGLNGDIFGYRHKYLKMADLIRQQYGCTVIVSSNPYDHFGGVYFGYTKDSIKDAVKLTMELGKRGNIYFFGHSNGALVGLEHAYKYSRIKRIMAVNAPLTVFNVGTINRLYKRYSNVSVIYGSDDDSSRYWKYLSFEPVILADTNHEFTGRVEEFIRLPFKYLF